ncbi:biotin-dependent carboxyltransferase family protein [Cognatiyoonia sp. IB215182]|uniref:5-oxoprolinase subunit C family protein n=1 Tax=Cognatiyoonia sp. IB215182 TaxID=3097353 RepID=UPI002A0F515F|nr:biotin-dependent carboxyltransferase family protein [Cognatiyoonia sp. IB215182]MDX8354113.1 biotin-dependent carboxyltransferase family protein [Cognatiyoonia sp. IB215182]
MPQLTIHHAGPGLTVQDLGRPGWKAQGLSAGGAVDRRALFEAAALLGASPQQAVIEMMGFGGAFSTDSDTRISLTGAQMQADIDGELIAANRTYYLQAGQKLTIGGAVTGVFGYLALAGGIATTPVMDSRAAHLTAGIGSLLSAGDQLPFEPDPAPLTSPLALSVEDRFTGGTIRIMPGPQTNFFSQETLQHFTATPFTRSPRGNRQGVRLDHDGAGFSVDGGRSIVSDLIVPGDIQMTGDGIPFVLLAECQTIGGYPRIGTVVPADLPKVAQAAPGTPLRFTFLSVEEADATAKSDAALLRELTSTCRPIIRDPHDIPDLLGYQLISGATPGDDLERP